MRSLFFKIFLRFWLTVVLVGVAIALSILYSLNRLQAERRAIASELLKQNTFAEVFETSGPPSLAMDFKQLETRHAIVAFLLGEDGTEALGRNPPPEVREVAKVVRRSGEAFIGAGYAGRRQTGPGGAMYSLVLAVGGPQNVKAIIASAFVFQLPVISLIGGGLFCYLITRHITTPLSRLRRATADLADGRLDTRVGASLGRRHDEIGALGADFDRMAERIDTLVTGQRRLLGDVSHELRSPLSRLLVALSLVQQHVGATSEPGQDAPEHLDRIAREARRLDALIGQLLTLSRIDSGVQIGARGPIDVTNLMHEVASDGDFEARALGRRVLVIAADAYVIDGFEELLRSALENVVRNAVRHTREGTSVEMSLQRLGGPGGGTVLRVRDHGDGVPDAMLADMFLPFRRVPAPAGEETEGAGLGLAIAARAVGVHNGTVRAMNAADGGLIVEIELPHQT